MFFLSILAALPLPVADDPVTVEAALARLEERGNGVTDEDLAFVGQALELEELALTHSRRVTDAGLAHLTGLERLKRLDLTGCRTVTPAGLEIVARLPALEHLVLSSTGTRDVGALAAATGLRSLAVNNASAFHGGGLSALTNLERLELSCVRGAMGDAGVTEIGKLTALRELDLSHCAQVTDKGLAHLAGLNELRSLSLYGLHKITTPGFNAVLPRLENLEVLDLGFCWWHGGQGMQFPPRLRHVDLRESKRIVDEVIVNLPKGELAYLNLHYCHELTDASLLALRGLDALQHLDVGSIRALTDVGLAALATNGELRVLDVSDNDHFTDAGLAELAALSLLEELSLWHTKNLTGSGSGWLGDLTRLRVLNLADSSGFDDEGMIHLRGMRQLTELYLDQTAVTDAGLASLASLPLRELTLTGCAGITDAAIPQLAQLEGLTYLSLLDCPNLSEVAVASLREALPNCRIAR